MRLLVLALSCAFFAIFGADKAFAACKPDALGTHRVITIDPDKNRRFIGHEKRLGLKAKEVILTFDDGPRKGTTSKILKALKDECVKATFFSVGRMALANRKLTKRVVAHGHTLAHHTHGHERLPILSRKRASGAVEQGIANVEKAAYGSYDGIPVVPFFRYPYLARNKATDRMVRRLGLVTFDANIDSLDWKRVSPDEVHNRTMRILRREGRGIILLHDIQHRTAKMLPKLLRTLKKEGYKVVHMVPPNAIPQVPQDDTPIVVASADVSKPTPSQTQSHKVEAASPVGIYTKAQSKSLIEQALADMAPVDDMDWKTKRKPVLKTSNWKMASSKIDFVSLRSTTPAAVVQSFKGIKLRSNQWIIR